MQAGLVSPVNLSRRKFLIGSLALPLLVACGESSSPSKPSATESSPELWPRTLRQHNGSLTVPAEPRRAFALGSWDLDFLLALGIAPAGAFLTQAPFVWLENSPLLSQTRIIRRTQGAADLSMEDIAATSPDLIVDVAGTWSGSPYSGGSDQYSRLSQIAATVSAPSDPVADDWRSRLRHLGKATGREQQAESAIGATDAEIAAAKRAHPQFSGKTVTQVLVSPGGVLNIVVDASDFSRQFLAEFGFGVPQAQVAALRTSPGIGGTTLQVSFEQLRLLEADAILFGLQSDAVLANNPAYHNLDAVKRGRVLSLNADASFAMRVPSPLTIQYFVRTVIPRLGEILLR